MILSNEASLPTHRVGVLGGTFDPPHNGHLFIARQALEQLKLDQVLFAPTRQPPHKLAAGVTRAGDRLAMVRLAIENEPHFRISRVDMDRAGATYTVDTIRILQQQFGSKTKLYFIMGMDSLVNLLTWHKPEELIRLCTLAVFPRPGFKADLDLLEQQLPGLSNALVLLSAPPLDISASDLQARIGRGESIEDLVPAPVCDYIRSHDLYHPLSLQDRR